MSTVFILHAIEWTGMPFLSPAQRLEVAYAYSPDQPSDLELEHIFRQNNAVDGTERNVQNEARSLSVGDVVVIDEIDHAHAFMVAISGFEVMKPAWLVPLLGWEL